MGLNAFLSKKKTENADSMSVKLDLGAGKSKKDI